MSGSASPLRRAEDTDKPKARIRIVLDDLVHVVDDESVDQVPLQQRRGEQDLGVVKATHERAFLLHQEVVFFGESTYERTDVGASDVDVLEHGLHICETTA